MIGSCGCGIMWLGCQRQRSTGSHHLKPWLLSFAICSRPRVAAPSQRRCNQLGPRRMIRRCTAAMAQPSIACRRMLATCPANKTCDERLMISTTGPLPKDIADDHGDMLPIARCVLVPRAFTRPSTVCMHFCDTFNEINVTFETQTRTDGSCTLFASRAHPQ